MGGGQSQESTSYGYLPYVSPDNARVIGNYQATAATQAGDIAKQQMAAAMANITSSFVDARSALSPYTSQGVQATDKLNQYLGLDPYNPGSAPTSPAAYTPSATEIKSYLGNNIGYNAIGGDNNLYAVYNGTGAKYDGWSKTSAGGPDSGQMVLGYAGTVNPGETSNPGGHGYSNTASQVDSLYNNADIRGQVSNMLGQQYADNNKDYITAQQKQYNQDLAAYNQNKAWYDQYKGQGAKTQEQIQQEVQNQPGYAAQLNEGINAVQKTASARGLLGSGNMLKDLTSFAGNLEGQYYQNMLQNLSQQAGVGANAAGQVAQAATGSGGALAQLRSNLSDTLSNSALARGQAQAQAYQLGNTQYHKVVTGQASSSSGGGLSGIGSLLGSAASLAQTFSSKSYKTKGTKVNFELDNLGDLPVEKWSYKPEMNLGTEDHIGPYAEDFQKVFGVGDGKTISLIDSIGVIFGLIKTLNEKVDNLSNRSTD
jgi:hypothetical protein